MKSGNYTTPESTKEFFRFLQRTKTGKQPFHDWPWKGTILILVADGHFIHNDPDVNVETLLRNGFSTAPSIEARGELTASTNNAFDVDSIITTPK